MISKKLLFGLALFAAFFHSPVEAASPFKVGASALIGYDNNPGSDSERKGDAFAQESVILALKKRLNPDLVWRASADVINIHYFEATDENVFRPGIGTGVDYRLNADTYLEADIDFVYLAFPNDEDVSSFNSDGRIGLVRRVVPGVYARAGATLGRRDFEEGKSGFSSGADTPNEREDDRWSADASLEWKLNAQALLRFGYAYLRNDSNDQFFDYYDYDASRWQASVVLLPSRDWRVQARIGYEEREYDLRPTRDLSRTEDDDIYSASVSAFYKLSIGPSLGYTVSYRQKDSNEPSQEYSGLVNTLGLYFSF